MKRKVIISYKKNKVLNQARLTLDRELISSIGVTDDKDNNISFVYKEDEIKLRKINKPIIEKIILDKEKNLKEFTKNTSFFLNYTNKEKNYYTYNLSIPLLVAKAMELDNNSFVNILPGEREIRIKKYGGIMNKIYTIKVNKGGIGKTFITVQLGAGLALQGYKVLLLTSDSQNNILHYTMNKKDLEKHDMVHGLRHVVLYGDNKELYIKIRKNLDFIPTESSIFTEIFEKKFEVYIEKKREEYDFILIDSIPTMDIDKKFVEYSDKIIVPTFCDYSTTAGTIKVIKEAGVEKVHSVIVNLFKPTSNQTKYYLDLKNVLEETDVIFPEPIQELSLIEGLIEKGKTIWESKSKKLLKAQNSLLDIIDGMVEDIKE